MDRKVARWQSRGGAHVVELREHEQWGYAYRANDAGGQMGPFPSDEEAIQYFEMYLLASMQPDANKTPMKRAPL